VDCRAQSTSGLETVRLLREHKRHQAEVKMANRAQERLGHKKIATTLDINAHALPSMQQDAAAKLGRPRGSNILFGAVSSTWC
jgi:tRNA C32,U32 (ribose-2'-O)-methylase TrmJ